MAHCCPPVVEYAGATGRGPSTDRERGGKATSLEGGMAMSHRVNTAMNSVQPARKHPAPNRIVRYAEAAELDDRENAILAGRQLSDPLVGWDDFYVHFTDKSPQTKTLPASRAVFPLAGRLNGCAC